ncbi:MAG: metallophosphatase family protein [Silicimonas sp.]|jgi:predicted phosphodiesterase|nr:metallophosphatase family protein [Silicimonas sp.]
MRLAVLSDIHGNSAALEAVLDDIGRHGIAQVVNLGDCFSGPLDGEGTARLLADTPMLTVSGNHDRLLVDRPASAMGLWESWVIEDLSDATLDWVRSLPLTATLGELFLCHGTPGSDDENWLDHRGPDQRLVSRDLDATEERLNGVSASVILCGHTHTPRSIRLPGGQRIVNPGSVGCPAYLDTRMEPHFVHQTGAPDARYAILESVAGDWMVTLRSVPYDAEPMIAMAEAKGASSWAQALRHGWLA